MIRVFHRSPRVATAQYRSPCATISAHSAIHGTIRGNECGKNIASTAHDRMKSVCDRDHHAIMHLPDFDRTMPERAMRIASRAIQFEDSLDDEEREDDQISAERDHDISEVTTSVARARPRTRGPSR